MHGIGYKGWTAWQLWRSQELIGITNVQLFRHMMRHHGGREWYRNHRDYFPPDFRTMLEELLAEVDEQSLANVSPEESSGMFAGALKSS